MLDLQRSRGPDFREVWASGAKALGVDRLSILDLSPGGNQPLATPDMTSVLAYNGEVYNWRELREELVKEGVAFNSSCDTEVVLHALDRWGPEIAIPRFNGMFAFAWLDLKKDVLWLARDRIGIKPLYFADTAGAFVFASEAKSLFVHPAIERRLDTHALTTFVYMNVLYGDWTGFEGVQAVAPGTAMRITRERTETLTWFDICRDLDVDRLIASRQQPYEKLVEDLRSRIERSVEIHLQSDAPLAVMCSGGLDSSLATEIAKRHRSNLVAFVAEVEGAPVAEAEKAQQVADYLGVKLNRVGVSKDEYPELWAQASWHNDDPITFYQNPLTLKVSQAVHDEGFKVLVTGEGADELLGGYPWHLKTARMWNRRKWQARFVRDIAPLRALRRFLELVSPVDLAAMGAEPFTSRSHWKKEQPAFDLVVDSGRRRYLAESLFKKLEPIKDLAERGMLANTYYDIYHYLTAILTSNDKMTMSASVEMRVPFVENDVIDFSLHLHARAKLYKGSRKRILKSVARGLLPSDIVAATKVGFSTPTSFWSGYEAILRGGIVPDIFKWAKPELGRIEQILADNPLLAHKLVTTELWAQLHINGESPGRMAERLKSVRATK